MSENIHKMREIPVGPKFKLNPRGRFWSFFCHRQMLQENRLESGGVHVEKCDCRQILRGYFPKRWFEQKCSQTKRREKNHGESGKKRLYRYVREPSGRIKIGVEKFTAAQYLIFRILGLAVGPENHQKIRLQKNNIFG